MEAPRVEIPSIVWKRPLKKVATLSPECLAMGSIWLRVWPCSERRPVLLLFGGERVVVVASR